MTISFLEVNVNLTNKIVKIMQSFLIRDKVDYLRLWLRLNWKNLDLGRVRVQVVQFDSFHNQLREILRALIFHLTYLNQQWAFA